MEQSRIESELQSELASGERLLWSGNPGVGVSSWLPQTLFIAFSVLLVGWAVMSGNTTASGDQFFSWSWGILFALTLIVMTASLVLGLRIPHSTSYGVTDERVLIISRLFGRHLTSIPLSTLENAALSMRGGGGTIVLVQRAESAARAPVSMTRSAAVLPVLKLSRDAQHVHELILRGMGTAAPSGLECR